MNLVKTISILTALFAFNMLSAQSNSGAKASKPSSTVTIKSKSYTVTSGAVTLKEGLSYSFDKEKIDLGRVKKGTKKTFSYIMTNTGTENIEIEIVSGCDCTTLDWTRGVIKPGQKATINSTFDSTEKELTEKSTDVDVYLKNKNPKTGASIFKILNFTYDLY
jgi:hypothetical protein